MTAGRLPGAALTAAVEAAVNPPRARLRPESVYGVFALVAHGPERERLAWLERHGLVAVWYRDGSVRLARAAAGPLEEARRAVRARMTAHWRRVREREGRA